MKQYHDLLEAIKKRGSYKEPAREGMPGSTSLFGYQERFDLTNSFPIVTTKKMFWKGIVVELLWFLRGDTNIKYLDENKVTKMWHQDAYNFYVKLCPQFHIQPISFEEFCIKVAAGERLGCYTYGDCGEQYGLQWMNFDKRPNYIVRPKPTCATEPTKLGIADGSGASELSKVHGDIVTKLHTTWEQMIERCYNPSSAGYTSYGQRGVHVSNRWLIFRNFVEDVQELEGWDKKLKDWDDIQLDKDSLGHGFLYSENTCRWISRSDNMSSFNKIIVLENPDGELVHVQNIRAYAKSIGVNHANFVRLIKGERATAYDHKFLAEYDLNTGVNQIAEIIDSLKSSPYGRRHIVTAWNPTSLNNMALHPCHALFQFNCRRITARKRCEIATRMDIKFHGLDTNSVMQSSAEWDKWCDEHDIPKYYLDCQLYQRSCDVLLGVPFNISSYALLTSMIAKVVNMVPGEFIHTFGDVHIYDNHMDAVNEQLTRDSQKYPLPKLAFNPNVDWLAIAESKDFSGLKWDDITLEGYESYPKLESDTVLSTGMKK